MIIIIKVIFGPVKKNKYIVLIMTIKKILSEVLGHII